MSALTMSRALTGARAFRVVPVGQKSKVQAFGGASNGAFATMRKKDSFMVEVEVGEDEPEDVAVRRFMKQVVQSKVVEKLRARKHKETKIEEYKRRFRERCEARKLERELGIREPTWSELYSAETGEGQPYAEFFAVDPSDPEAFLEQSLNGLNDDFFGSLEDSTKWGGYIGGGSGSGYMNTQQQAGYQTGGYMT